MKLSDWLTATQTTASALAREVGCSHTTIIRVARGEIEPRPDLRRRIVKATDGGVQEIELLQLDDGCRATAALPTCLEHAA